MFSIFKKKEEPKGINVVIDFATGCAIASSYAIPRRHIKVVRQWSDFGSRGQVEVTETVYFRKGTEPDCDYIKTDGNSEVSYWKKQPDLRVTSKGKKFVAQK